MVVDGYVRVSRVGNRPDLRSDKLQARAIIAEARRRGFQVAEVFRDLDQSGGREDRPGLLRAIERIEQGASAGIVLTRLDRFSRDLMQALKLAARIEEAGGDLYVIEEAVDFKSPDGALMVQLRLAIATHQRRLANAYFEKSKADAIERGIPINPRLAPGLVAVTNAAGKRIGVEIDERVAAIVCELFRRRVEERAGPAELADFLEAEGVTTSMGSATWSKQAIYGVLRNRTYLGELRNGKHVNRDAIRAIVDRPTWEAAQPGRATARPTSRPVESGFVLAGLLRCAACRYAMQGTTTSRRKRIYRCTVRHAGGRCSEPARVGGDEAERLVLDYLRGLAEAQPAAQREPDAPDLAAVHAEAEAADRELYRWAADVSAREALGEAAWLEGARERKAQAAAAAARLAEARAALPDPRGDLRQLIRDLGGMAPADLRAALGEAIDCIALRGRGKERELHIFLRGSGPSDLPRRGFKQAPAIRPFELPPAPSVLAA